jgi:hypothetical protein
MPAAADAPVRKLAGNGQNIGGTEEMPICAKQSSVMTMMGSSRVQPGETAISLRQSRRLSIVPSRYSPLSVTLKTEVVHHRQYQTRAEAQRDVFAYIDGFYNRTRLHSSIGYVAPIQMELKAA